MLIACLTEFAVGFLIVVIGLLIWLKQKISLLHSYHCANVKQAQIRAYTRLMVQLNPHIIRCQEVRDERL